MCIYRTLPEASLALVLLVLVPALESVQGRGLLQDASPTIVQGQISAQTLGTCAIKSTGLAWCWGVNEFGQIGDGSVSSSQTPVLVSGGTWLQISVGEQHTCTLKYDSTAWCWGANKEGQLGNGDNSDVAYSVAVAGGGTWLQISAGGIGAHTCGIKSNNSAWCWGGNEYGQLGDTTLVNKNIPTMVAGGGTWIQISAGYFHTCGIKADKSAWCWGETYSGEKLPAVLDAPKAVASNGTWLQISAGFDHTCGIKTDQSLWCWGNDPDSDAVQFLAHNSGVPTAISGGSSWLQVSVGYTLVCGITSDFSAWCWGDNADGQLGDGTSGNIRKTPVKVYGDYTWKEVSADYMSACGITQQGTAMCWGSASESGLGSEGPATNIPRAVAGDGLWGQERASATSPLPAKQDLTPAPSPNPEVKEEGGDNLEQQQESPASSPTPSFIDDSGTVPSGELSPSSSINTGAIVGGVVGGVAVLAAIAAVLIIWRKRRHSAACPPETTSTQNQCSEDKYQETMPNNVTNK